MLQCIATKHLSALIRYLLTLAPLPLLCLGRLSQGLGRNRDQRPFSLHCLPIFEELLTVRRDFCFSTFASPSSGPQLDGHNLTIGQFDS